MDSMYEHHNSRPLVKPCLEATAHPLPARSRTYHHMLCTCAEPQPSRCGSILVTHVHHQHVGLTTILSCPPFSAIQSSSNHIEDAVALICQVMCKYGSTASDSMPYKHSATKSWTYTPTTAVLTTAEWTLSSLLPTISSWLFSLHVACHLVGAVVLCVLGFTGDWARSSNSHVLARPLAAIVDAAIQRGILPDQVKSSLVTPGLKKGDRCDQPTSNHLQWKSLSADGMLPCSITALSAGLKMLACGLLARQPSALACPQSISCLLCVISLTASDSRSTLCLRPLWTSRRSDSVQQLSSGHPYRARRFRSI